MSNSIRIVRRIIELGPTGCWKRITHRIKLQYYYRITKQAALSNTAHTHWFTLQKQLNAATAKHCARQLFMQPIWNNILSHDLFKTHQPTSIKSLPKLLETAEKIYSNEFELFGCKIQLPINNIPWQTDVTLPIRKQQGIKITNNYLTEDLNKSFFSTIKIPSTKAIHSYEYASDIKVPWELSRLQHLFFMGKAYEYYNATHELIKADNYAKWVKNHLLDWTTNNPYLLGVNWLCPMDVAIRAINIIFALNFFAYDNNFDESFWQKILCLLYDHARYLEKNWELSDKPNNHYLADLTGYLYLCLFFNKIPHFKTKLAITFKKIIGQIHQQLLPDGTSYEGSTAYHKLNTEMILHATLIGKINNLPEAQFLQETFFKMLPLLQDCTNTQDSFITIGDNDSGKLVAGITISTCPEKTLHSYEHFGLTIVKSKIWHLSLRHATYKPNQPSGHFHLDQLSITLACNNLPLLIDPGSFAYTSNPGMRNFLRSWQAHSTFTCINNTVENFNELFQLNRKKETSNPVITRQENELITLQAAHYEDPCNNKKFIRNIRITPITVTLEDSIVMTKPTTKPTICNWNFVLHPAITAYQKNDHSWLLCYKQLPICSLASSLPLIVTANWYSPSYGTLIPTTALSCSYLPTPNHHVLTTFTST